MNDEQITYGIVNYFPGVHWGIGFFILPDIEIIPAGTLMGHGLVTLEINLHGYACMIDRQGIRWLYLGSDPLERVH